MDGSWESTARIVAFFAGVLVGSLALTGVLFVWVKNQTFGFGGAVLSGAGVILIGLSAWQSVQLGVSREGFQLRTQSIAVVQVAETQQRVQSALIEQTKAQQKQAGEQSPRVTKEEITEIVEASGKAALARSSVEGPVSILWVDDHPDNNAALRSAFETLGMKVVAIKSDAEIETSYKKFEVFDVIITDMGRGEKNNPANPRDEFAGLKTIEIIRSQHPGTPVIVFSSHASELREKGVLQPPVIDITNRPHDVLSAVTTFGIRHKRSSRNGVRRSRFGGQSAAAQQSWRSASHPPFAEKGISWRGGQRRPDRLPKPPLVKLHQTFERTPRPEDLSSTPRSL